MARQVTRAQARKRRDNRMGFIIFGIAGLVAISVVAGALLYGPAKAGPDGCPLGAHAAPPAKTIILVDQTDTLPKPELVYLRSLIINEYHWLPMNGVLAVRGIHPDMEETKDQIVVCRISDGSDSDGVFSTPQALKRDFDRKVGKRLDDFLGEIAATRPAPTSPIAEAVAATFGDTRFGSDIKARRLVVMSDMAQNTAVYTQYHRSDKARFILPDEDDLAADMANTTVRIQYVRRRSIPFQGPRHIRFWKRYFEKMGAGDIAIGHALGIGESADRPIWHDTASGE